MADISGAPIIKLDSFENSEPAKALSMACTWTGEIDISYKYKGLCLCSIVEVYLIINLVFFL